MSANTPIVFLPGLVCDAAVWAPQLAALGRSATVVHYGRANTLAEMARIALAAAPAGRFALAGHSMGGRIAFEMLRLAPERIERVALLDTGCAPLPAGEAGEKERAFRMDLLATARRDGMRVMAAEWAQGMVHPSRLGGPVFEVVLEMFGRRDAETFEAQLRALLARHDATPVLPTIGGPALFLTGAQDDWSPPAAHRAMHEAVPGSQLVVVPDCGHMSTIEAPSAVNAALAAWLAA